MPFFKTPELLSIEIGSEILKLACVKLTARGGKVLRLISTDITAMSDEDISQFIKDYLNKERIKTDQVITSIPARFTITKNIELPSTDPREIKEIIRLQAGRHTPYSPEEIVIDYFPIGTYKGGYSRILLVIVNRDVINRNLEIVEGAELKLKRVILAPEGMAQWYYPNLRQDQVTCLIHFDYGTTDVMMVSNQKLTFVRSLPFGTYQLIHERQKYEEKFEEEIKKSLETYQTENIESVNHAILTGAIDQMDFLQDNIKKETNLSVKLEHYIDHLVFSQEATSTIESGGAEVSFLPVVTSALRYRKASVDLTPEVVRLREAMAEKSRDIIFMGTLIMFILIIISAILAEKIYFKKIYLDSLNKEYRAHHPEVIELEEKDKKTRLVKHCLFTRTHTLNSLDELYRLIVPRKQIYLDSIIFEADRQMKICGKAKTVADTDNLVDALERSPCFKEVSKSYTTGVTVKDKKLFEFELICRFEGPESQGLK